MRACPCGGVGQLQPEPLEAGAAPARGVEAGWGLGGACAQAHAGLQGQASCRAGPYRTSLICRTGHFRGGTCRAGDMVMQALERLALVPPWLAHCKLCLCPDTPDSVKMECRSDLNSKP